jgi:serine/threonine protein phosphatase 1
MNRAFVIGDIHGAYRALRQCLQKAAFDYTNDHLICLGDVCDGWPEILGNHDYWALQWMITGKSDSAWLLQGGESTKKSYQTGLPASHIKLLTEALPYFLMDNKLFVHAGINPKKEIDQQDLSVFLWDRSLTRTAIDFYNKNINVKLTEYDEVYVGHTPIPSPKPVFSCGVWLMDTGAGWNGVLSMMEINTNKIFTSDNVPALYPGIEGRKPKMN